MNRIVVVGLVIGVLVLGIFVGAVLVASGKSSAPGAAPAPSAAAPTSATPASAASSAAPRHLPFAASLDDFSREMPILAGHGPKVTERPQENRRLHEWSDMNMGGAVLGLTLIDLGRDGKLDSAYVISGVPTGANASNDATLAAITFGYKVLCLAEGANLDANDFGDWWVKAFQKGGDSRGFGPVSAKMTVAKIPAGVVITLSLNDE